jgi:hypothetical protein
MIYTKYRISTIISGEGIMFVLLWNCTLFQIRRDRNFFEKKLNSKERVI